MLTRVRWCAPGYAESAHPPPLLRPSPHLITRDTTAQPPSSPSSGTEPWLHSSAMQYIGPKIPPLRNAQASFRGMVPSRGVRREVDFLLHPTYRTAAVHMKYTLNRMVLRNLYCCRVREARPIFRAPRHGYLNVAVFQAERMPRFSMESSCLAVKR